MENYSKVTRFCFICNYVSRIIEPLASRCAKFRFKPLHEGIMTERVQYICGREGVKLDEQGQQQQQPGNWNTNERLKQFSMAGSLSNYVVLLQLGNDCCIVCWFARPTPKSGLAHLPGWLYPCVYASFMLLKIWHMTVLYRPRRHGYARCGIGRGLAKGNHDAPERCATGRQHHQQVCAQQHKLRHRFCCLAAQ